MTNIANNSQFTIPQEISLNGKENEGTTKPLDPKDFLINLADDVPDPHPLLSIDGRMVFSPQNIGIIKAKAKAGKSFLCSIISAAFLGKQWGGMESSPLVGKYKVKIIDSEQAEAHVHKIARRVHRLCGFDTKTNYPYLDVYLTKDLTNDERFELLETIASDPETGLIIFDGVVDLVNDFNSLEECTAKKDRLLKLVKQHNIFLLGVIHENKKDANSRGHWGAFLEQKSETTMQIVKDGEYFEISPAYCRNIDFEPFGFRIVDGLPIPADATDRPNPNHTKQQDIFRKIISGTSTMNYKDLITNYIDHSGLSEPTAKRHIALNFSNGFFEKNETGSYWIKNNND